jgi:transcriptional regulator with XRE-family HTH domain
MQEAGPEARLASFLANVLRTEEISQAELARRVDVSQSTVSRVLRMEPLRHGPARRKLVNFMHQGGLGRGAEQFQGTFRRIWDGSDEHAEALARIIAACEGLRPAGRGVGHDDR